MLPATRCHGGVGEQREPRHRSESACSVATDGWYPDLLGAGDIDRSSGMAQQPEIAERARISDSLSIYRCPSAYQLGRIPLLEGTGMCSAQSDCGTSLVPTGRRGQSSEGE